MLHSQGFLIQLPVRHSDLAELCLHTEYEYKPPRRIRGKKQCHLVLVSIKSVGSISDSIDGGSPRMLT